jgi:large subunit ribosomal protein L24
MIKKGDNVIVISGVDKGKTGKVVRAFPASGKVLIEGVNLKKRHQRKTRENQKGQIIEKALPIDASKVMIIDLSSGKRTRIGSKMVGGKKVRVSVKSGKEL